MITLVGALSVLAILTGVFLILNVVSYVVVIPTELSPALQSAAEYMWLVDSFLPVTEMAKGLAFAMVVAFAVFVLKTGFYVIALLRGNTAP